MNNFLSKTIEAATLIAILPACLALGTMMLVAWCLAESKGLTPPPGGYIE